METGSLHLSSNVLLWREKQTVMSVKTVKNLMDYIKGLIQNEQFPAQIGHTERPTNVKGTMELK